MNMLGTGTQFGELRIIDMLLYYDGPQLCVCENSLGHLHLVLAIKETPEGLLWLAAPASETRIQAVCHGTMPLRTAYVESESPTLYKLLINRGSILSVEHTTAAELSDSELPKPGVVIQHELELPTDRLATVIQTSRATGRNILRVAFDFGFQYGNGAPLKVLGDLLGSIQDIANATESHRRGHDATRGPYSRDVVDAAELQFANSFSGSIGVEIRSGPSVDAFGENSSSSTFERLGLMFAACRNTDQLASLPDSIGHRATAKFRDFVKHVGDRSAKLDYEWAFVNGRSDNGHLGRVQLATALDKLIEENLAETSSERMSGELRAINLDKKTFDFRESSSRERYSGHIADSLLHRATQWTLPIPITATIRLEKHYSIGGGERETLTLEDTE